MFQLLVVAIVMLTLVGLFVAGRTRLGGADPSSSVDAFHRALTAMEPGAGRGRPAPYGDGADGDGAGGDEAAERSPHRS